MHRTSTIRSRSIRGLALTAAALAAGVLTPATASADHAPEAGECQGTGEIVEVLESGFLGSVTVRNDGDSTVDGWSLSWTWGGDQRIAYLWNAEWSQSGASVTTNNFSWNGTLAPGDEIEIGFIAPGEPGEFQSLACEFN